MYSNFTDPPPDYEPLQGEIVPLEAADFLAANRMGQRIAQGENFDRRQWAVYLHYLCLQALHRWWGQHTVPITIDDTQALILTPETSHGPTALCRLSIGSFQICLVVADGSADAWQMPKAVVMTPDFAAHFYLVMMIHEESSQAEILGFLRHDHIPNQALEGNLYQLAIADLNPNLDTLLLYLSCLEPSAILLPIAATPRLNLRQLLIQPVLSTQQWLNQQIDHLAEAIAWQLLPPWETTTATRGIRDMGIGSPMDRLSNILTSLVRGGMTLPIEHRPAYRDLKLGHVNLRLYAITAAQEEGLEWSLVVILCQQDGSDLLPGIQMQVQDEMTVLVDRQVDGSGSGYLYAKVSGELTEVFTVTLSQDVDTLTLPPFAFQ